MPMADSVPDHGDLAVLIFQADVRCAGWKPGERFAAGRVPQHGKIGFYRVARAYTVGFRARAASARRPCRSVSMAAASFRPTAK